MKQKKRIEIHLDEKSVKLLDNMAESQDRTRKKLCEIIIKETILAFIKEKQHDTV